MGLMISGVWSDTDSREVQADGRFVRTESAFRNWITADGSAGPTGTGGFKAESGRYHLYVSYACPWAHRALIYRSVLGLEAAIGVSVVHPVNREKGWGFADYPGATGDAINGARHLYEIYALSDPDYSGKVTVPVLWDVKTGAIVNNESAEIIRMLGEAFRAIASRRVEFYPEELRVGIDELNEFTYRNVNNAVYRCGFARTQDAYEQSVAALFSALDTLEARLEGSRYLFGERIVETDWRLFPTLIRFDPVYYFHFKCNRRPLSSYPAIMRYTRDLLDQPGIRETVHMDHIIDHYYLAHRRINPMGIIPVGARAALDGPPWSAPGPSGVH
ncbi:MAG: glutathione S-transferase family protein [Rhodospirillales bacterium]|nr:MAG: glutathione S-transferase family protein [Rhodospirillales bacterium]